MALRLQSLVLSNLGRWEAAVSVGERLLRLARQQEEPDLVLGILGILPPALTHTDRKGEAISLEEERLHLARERKDSQAEAQALQALGAAALEQGQARHAEALFGDLLALARRLGPPPNRFQWCL